MRVTQGKRLLKPLLFAGLICGVLSSSFSFTASNKIITNSIGMKFVLIPAGTFTMGSPWGEPMRNPDERQHIVTITKSFYLQTTEVTQGQWKRVMGNNPSHFQDCGDACPVEMVSWNDAKEFLQKLNQREATNRYRLPSEAEWEYACRAGSNTPYNTGKCITADQANFNGKKPMPNCRTGEYRKKTVPVGIFSPNQWGLYDMHGNVWEWCREWYGKRYPKGEVVDPMGPSQTAISSLRGGSWFSGARIIRSAYRRWEIPDFRSHTIGFRVARDF